MGRAWIALLLVVNGQARADEAALRAVIAELAAPELDGRAAGSRGDAAARRIVVDRMRNLGLEPGGPDGAYEQPFSSGDIRSANVVGVVRGASDDILVVGAHLDHLGGRHLGANDDASGVAGLLAIAQALRQRPHPPRRTVAFVAFGGEEVGLLGSRHFVDHPPRALPLERVVAYINLDMLGSYNSDGIVYAFGTFRETAAGPRLARLARRFPELEVGLGGHSVRGDQVPFCAQRIPYVFFWTPDEACYHQTCDRVENLDLPHLAQIAQLATDLVVELADTDADLAAARARVGCGR
jgi:Zn-dependent M28 family amino/carboxypeptidase